MNFYWKIGGVIDVKGVIINQGHTSNIGDKAILEVMTKYYKSKKCDVEFVPYWESKAIRISRLNKGGNYLERLILNIPFLVDAINRKRIENIIQNRRYDFAVIGGGELIGGHKGFNSSFFCWVDILTRRNIPVYVIGVSGVTSEKIYRNRYKKAMKKCSAITVRDYDTYNIINNEYGIKVQYYPDIVFSYRKNIYGENIEKRNVLSCFPVEYRKNFKETLGCNNESEYIEYLINLIINKNRKRYKIIISTTTIEDVAIARKIYDKLSKLQKENVVFSPCNNIEELTTILKVSNVVISARMHAMILALQYKAKIVPILIKKKLEVFAAEYSEVSDIFNIGCAAEKSLVIPIKNKLEEKSETK